MEPSLWTREGIRPLEASVRAAAGAPRASEWTLALFFGYVLAAALIFPLAPSARISLTLVNTAILAAYTFLIYFDNESGIALSVVRDWLPLALLLAAYREMGCFAAAHPAHVLEARWIAWDRLLLLRAGGKAAVEAMGPVLPSALEIAYSLVYAIAPFSVAALYLCGRRREAGRFVFLVALAVLLCYAQFPFWPSEPPRVVFPGGDLAAYDTVFRRFNLWMLGHCGIHTSVFPSAHVAGAFSAAFGMWRAFPRRKWAGGLLFGLAILIAAATVYGRYHYAADAAAGCLMALAALRIANGVQPARDYAEINYSSVPPEPLADPPPIGSAPGAPGRSS